MQIRSLVDDDVDAVVALSLAAWAPVFEGVEQELGPTVHRLLFPDWPAAQAQAVEAVLRSPEHTSWVATVDDRPVGFVAIHFADEDAARVGEIDMVAVDPGCQRAGVGAMLVRHTVEQIRAAGVGLAVLGTGAIRATPRPARCTSRSASARTAWSGTTGRCRGRAGYGRRPVRTPHPGSGWRCRGRSGRAVTGWSRWCCPVTPLRRSRATSTEIV